PNQAGRQYRVATDKDYKSVHAAADALNEETKRFPQGQLSAIPDEPLPWKHGHRAVGSPRVYGMKTWGDLFTSRQKLVLLSLCTAISNLKRAETTTLTEVLGLAASRFADI